MNPNPPHSYFALLFPPKLLALRIPVTIEVWHGVLQKCGRLHPTYELFLFADLFWNVLFQLQYVCLVHSLTQSVRHQ